MSSPVRHRCSRCSENVARGWPCTLARPLRAGQGSRANCFASQRKARGSVLRGVRVFWKFLFVLIGLGLVLAAPAHAQRTRKKKAPKTAAVKPPQKVLTRADSLVLRARVLLEQWHEAEALELCRRALRNNPAQYEALWRASVLCSHVGARFSDETRQQQYYHEARDLAVRALDIHSDFATANYAMALAVTSGGSLAPLRGRLGARLEEKKYLDAALRDEPRHADAWQLLARWQFKTANYTVFETLASKLLLGSIPHDASNAQAVAAIQKAIELNPKRIAYYYDYARMSLLKGRRQVALQTMMEAQQRAELVTNEDLAVSRQMELLLQRLQRRQKIRGPELEPR